MVSIKLSGGMPVPTLVEQHLVRLVEELGLGALAPKDELKRFKLVLGPEMSIFVQEGEEGFFLFSRVAKVPPKKREELFILLMKANFLGQGTGGSAIGMEEDEKFLTLSLAIPYEMEYKAFRETIEDFANFVDYWKAEVLKHSQMAEEIR